MPPKNLSQENNITSENDSNYGEDRYEGLLHIMGLDQDDTPSSSMQLKLQQRAFEVTSSQQR